MSKPPNVTQLSGAPFAPALVMGSAVAVNILWYKALPIPLSDPEVVSGGTLGILKAVKPEVAVKRYFVVRPTLGRRPFQHKATLHFADFNVERDFQLWRRLRDHSLGRKPTLVLLTTEVDGESGYPSFYLPVHCTFETELPVRRTSPNVRRLSGHRSREAAELVRLEWLCSAARFMLSQSLNALVSRQS